MENDLQEDALEVETPENDEEVDKVEETDDEPDYDTLKAERDEAIKDSTTNKAKALHWKNKAAKKAEAKKQPKTPDLNNESDSQEWREKMELKTDGYNEDEVAYLMKNGGLEATKDKFVMAGIEKIREQTKAEEATATSKSSGSGVLKNVTEAQLAKMTSAQIEEKMSSGK